MVAFPFATSLHALISRIGEPIHDLLPFSNQTVDEEHVMLWQCYLSGQMTDAALIREMAADPDFADVVKRKSSNAH